MEFIWLLLAIAVLAILLRPLFRSGIKDARSSVGPDARSMARGSPQVITLIKRIEALGSSSSPALESVRDFSQLFHAVRYRRLTAVQRDQVTPILTKSLEGKHVSWELGNF